jgi:hypothetical protein
LTLPDRRQHRGPHPADRELFAPQKLPDLRSAVSDLNWLLSRNYAPNSSLKLVGDRYGLLARQRIAVGRCACADENCARRKASQITARELAAKELWIDGYNVLTTLEAALAGGVILKASDGCYRDMASMHGSYRKVAETIPAIEMTGELLQQANIATCIWYLDQPVSNSGRLKTMLRELAESKGWPWEVQLVSDPDKILIETDKIVASADSQVIDGASPWFNLARHVIDSRIADAWFVDLCVQATPT